MSRRTSPVAVPALLAAALTALVLGCASLLPTGGPLVPTPPAAEAAVGTQRPNIVLISTDDQTAYDLRWMPRTRAVLGERGRTFTRALSPHPLCCPARAELLTGQYAQNNHVQHNVGPYGGFKRLREGSTTATWLRDAGYSTAFHGKYLNGYGAQDPRQPGWTFWDPLVRGTYSFTDFTFWNNRLSRQRRFVDSYVTDVLARRTNASVRRFAAADRPFFIWASHVAPHAAVTSRGWGPPIPAARHRGLFRSAQPPALAKPNFNERNMADQPSKLRNRNPVSTDRARHQFRQRIRSLQAVDEAVASLVRTLAETGELTNTWIFFTSDNGYSLGEHRYFGKNFLNREQLEVPLLVRGPGVGQGTTSRLPATLVDLAPTFADLAGVTPGLVTDGRSFRRNLLGRDQPWRDTQLIQTGTHRRSTQGWEFRGVLTRRYSFGRDPQTGERFLYDHAVDPYEVRNLARNPAYAGVVAELARRTRLLSGCAGVACHRVFGPVAPPSR